MGMKAAREIQYPRKEGLGVGFVIAMRMDEEQAAHCDAVGIWVKVGGETHCERWRPHRRLLKMVLASKKERLIYDPKTSSSKSYGRSGQANERGVAGIAHERINYQMGARTNKAKLSPLDRWQQLLGD